MAKLKTLLAPRFWRVPKKVRKWTVSPSPGPHKKFESIPLQIIVRDILKLVETGKEAKIIINRGEVLVDGKVKKDHAYPVGLFDVIGIPRLRQFYRVVPCAGGLKLIEIPEKESSLKICKIVNKTIVKKGKIQLNLHDGKNVLVDKDEYKTGDSLLVELPSLKIVKRVPLEKGNVGVVAKGKNSGKLGKVKDLIAASMRGPAKVICKIGDEDTEILKDQLFVVGESEPLITASE